MVIAVAAIQEIIAGAAEHTVVTVEPVYCVVSGGTRKGFVSGRSVDQFSIDHDTCGGDGGVAALIGELKAGLAEVALKREVGVCRAIAIAIDCENGRPHGDRHIVGAEFAALEHQFVIITEPVN